MEKLGAGLPLSLFCGEGLSHRHWKKSLPSFYFLIKDPLCSHDFRGQGEESSSKSD